MWKTTNYSGKEVIWYLQEEVKEMLADIKEIAQYDVYTSRTDLCLKLNCIKKKINEVDNDRT